MMQINNDFIMKSMGEMALQIKLLEFALDEAKSKIEELESKQCDCKCDNEGAS